MNKKLIFIVMLIFIIPLGVYADRTNTVSIDTVDSMKVGDRAKIGFTVDFKDIKQAGNDNEISTGFILYAIEFEFDDTVIDIYDLDTSSVWDATIYKDSSSGKYYMMAELNGKTDAGFCKNKVSYCDKAGVTISFGIKETDKTSTTIKVTGLGGALISSDGKSELSENDVKTVEENINKSKTITISKYEEQQMPKNDQPKLVIEEKKNVDVKQEIKKEASTTTKKQNTTANNNTTKIDPQVDDSKDISKKAYNNYLKTLEIEGYSIDFNKHQSIYSIEVPQEVKELKVNAVADGENAKVEIVGADNLEENNNKIVVTVTAANGEEKKYIVNVKRIKEEKKDNKGFFEITEDQKKLLIIFAGAIVGIGLIIFIIVRIRDRKIEKNINKW